MVYIENTGLRDCSGFLQIESHMCVYMRPIYEHTCLFFCITVSRSQLSAAHVCYHVGGAHLSQWDESQCKFSLLGVNHKQHSVTSSMDPSILWKTEVWCACNDDYNNYFFWSILDLQILHAFACRGTLQCFCCV